MDKILSCIIISIVVLLYITVCYGGDRRNIKTYDTGELGPHGNPVVRHYTLLDPGECDFIGCVIHEHTTQGGLLYQWFDENNDGECDRIIIWKKLVDPTWGTYYSIYATRACGGSI